MALQSEILRSSEQFSDHLALLAAFDPAIDSRIEAIKAGFHPNGHNPNGTLSNAMTPGNIKAQEEFLSEYHWAVAAEIYPYRTNESKNTLIAAASDALFTSGETYNPDVEPNFLTHFDKQVDAFLEEVFGPPAEKFKIPVDRFDQAVIENHLAEMPPLATKRPATAFAVGQRILWLTGGQLVDARVRSVSAYSSKLTLGPPVQLSDNARRSRENQLVEREQELARSKFVQGIMPDSEWLRIRLSMLPEFQQLVPNPSPGFISIASETDPVGLITDMHHNTIITEDAWKSIKTSRLYHEAWLVTGSVESLREQETLAEAIRSRTTNENSRASSR